MSQVLRVCVAMAAMVVAVIPMAGECQPGKDGAQAVAVSYPAVRREDRVDDYHGTKVADPYRWLESPDSAETRAFVAAQNAVSRPYLEALPGRERIKQRLTVLWNYERYELPTRKGGRYFYRRNDGLQNQSVLYVTEAIDAPARVLLDPNTLSQDGTVALAAWFVSPDGKHLAYGASDGGTDWKTWHVREVDSGRELSDEIRYTKFTDISWLPDASGFFYSRYPLAPHDLKGNGLKGSGSKDGGSKDDGLKDNSRADDTQQAAIYFHALGTPQSVDPLIFAIDNHPSRIPYGDVSDDGRYLIIDIFDGYAVNGIYYFELQGGRPKQVKPVRLFDGWNAHYTFIGNKEHELYFLTTQDAPNSRVIAVDVGGAQPRTRELVPQAPEVLSDASYAGGRILAEYLKDARTRVRVFDLKGRESSEVALPGAGTAKGFNGRAEDAETFFIYTDYLTPPAIYRYDIAANKSSLFRKPKIPVDTSPYLTEQVFFNSKDGTRVPMFITRKRTLKMNGRNPALLTGYGGFNVSRVQQYSAEVMGWIDMGGVYASVNLRGGGEYGEAWHEAGTQLKKQNVFDDFISAAEYLIAKQYTSPKHLAAGGRSNGGLLIGAVLTQRPELFAATLPAVGVLDMLRYDIASANARQWSSDYGLSESPEQFPALRAYSPYHNTRAGTCYPPTLVSTADHDDRVVPWHSYKFAAALQHDQACANPILLSVETRAGHGAGKPTWMTIEEVANSYAFLAKHLGL